MFGGNSGAGEARRARIAEEKREQRIREGTAQIRNKFATKFDEKYYTGVKNDATTFYGNEAKLQWDDAVKQMQYALARTGNWDSTAFANKKKESDLAMDAATRAIAQRSQGIANQRRGDVANAEGVAVNQLISSGDSAAAAIQAQNQIQGLSRPPELSPLGQIFTNFSGGLATQADLERSGQNRYTLFGRIPGWNQSNRYTTNVKS